MPYFPLEPLPYSFYDQPTDQVAQELIGCYLAHRDGEQDGEWRLGRIVETEAYLGEKDLACHSSRGRTPRTAVMFGPPGRAYVYLVYGMHHCFNVVTRAEGLAEAVLIRAIEPLQNCLTAGNGPGKVCQALNLSRALNGVDLTLEAGRLVVLPRQQAPGALVRGPRVGVDYAGHWAKRLLRFYEKDSPFVSKAGRSGRR